MAKEEETLTSEEGLCHGPIAGEVVDGHPLKKGWPAMKFDPTINLGHLLTVSAIMGGGFLAYSGLAERVTVQERLSAERTQQTRDSLIEIKGEIKELRSAVQQAIPKADRR